MESIRFNVSDVLTKLKQVVGVIESKPSTLEIFSCVHIFVKDGTLQMKSSDGETWVGVKILNPLPIVEKIDFCVNGKDFAQILSNLVGIEVTLEVDYEKKMVNGKYGRKGKFSLPIKDGSEFVDEPTNDTTPSTKQVIGETIKRGIELTEGSVANDELRPIMNGIHIEFTNEKIDFASSDGKKLTSFTSYNVKNDDESEGGFTLPLKPARILSQFALMEGIIEMSYTEKSISFKAYDWVITTRLCVGKYPNYRAVIPKEWVRSVVCDKNEMLSTLNRILPLGNKKSRLVKMKLCKDEMMLQAEDIDYSTSAEEAITCEYDGDDFIIGFNGDALMQMLKNINCDKVVIGLNENNKASVFIPHAQEEKTSYVSILMPMQL